MKVSFLVTYYNQKNYVKQSLDSILTIEKPCDWEIIVGDDGSTDGTIDEVKKYLIKYPDNIKLYIMPRDNNKKNNSVRRASANRLNILEHSTGDFFCMLDGDDYYCDRNFIGDALDIFYKYDDISIVTFGYRYEKKGVLGKEITLSNIATNNFVDKYKYLRSFYIHSGACVYKKSFGSKRIEDIKKLGYFDDNDIVINSLNYGEMYSISRAIYVYRQTGDSIFTSMTALEKAILNVQGMDIDTKLVDEDLKKVIIERNYNSLIIMYIWKWKLQFVLGNDKIVDYKTGCSSLMPSYCFELLNYSTTGYKNIELNKILKMALNTKKIFSIKQYIRYYFGRI